MSDKNQKQVEALGNQEIAEDKFDKNTANTDKLAKNSKKTSAYSGESSLKNDKRETANRQNFEAYENFTAVLIDKLLNFLRKGYFADFFENNEKWLVKTGLNGLYLASALGILLSFVLPIRYKTPWGASLVSGISWFLACIVIHYIAWKFLPVIKNAIDTTPTKLASSAFLDCFALLAGISGVMALLGGLLMWCITSSFDMFVGGIFIFFFCEYLLSLCLNPSNLNIDLDTNITVGEEFLGYISFFMKGMLKLIPIVFGSGIIFGILNMLELLFMKLDNPWLLTAKLGEIGKITTVALLPLTAYFVFLTYYFFIDLLIGILSIPTKLDLIKDECKN